MEPISVIIPWRAKNSKRMELFKNTLNCFTVQETISTNKKIKVVFEVIVVEQFTTDKNVSEVLASLSKISDTTHIILKHSLPTFNKSWCVNVGMKRAKYNVRIVMDADTLFGYDYLYKIMMERQKIDHKHRDVFICWNYLYAMPGKDNIIARIIRPDMTRALGGVWCITKETFDNLGGMNENYEGYGGEDNDMWERASFVKGVKLGAPLAIMKYPLVHQYHDWESVSEVAVPYFLKTRNNPQVIIERLRAAKHGKLEHPTYIRMDDLNGK